MSDRIHIYQLPEKESVLKSDYLVIENLVDTYKVKAEVFTAYLDECASRFETIMNSKIAKLTELEETIIKNEDERKLYYDQLRRNEEEREATFKTYEQKLSNMENRILDIEKEYQKVIQDEKSRQQEFEEIKQYIDTVKTAEEIRVSNETNRQNAEADRVATMNNINSAVESITRAEADRVASETERKQNEVERIRLYNELLSVKQEVLDATTDMNNDFNSIVVEYNQIKNVLDGVEEAESKRVAAENDRVIAENNRVSAENGRVTAESKRVTAENGRTNAEANRVSAETDRVSAENIRKAYYEEIKQFISSTSSTPVYAHVVGSVYATDSEEDPSIALGGGTWELLFGPVRLKVAEDNGDPLADDVEKILPYIWIWRRTA